MSSLQPLPETPAQRPRRKIELRYFLAGKEVSEDAFVDELERQGGRATVELFDLAAAEDARYRPTPAGQAAAEETAEGPR
jgi:hypothetical protein